MLPGWPRTENRLSPPTCGINSGLCPGAPEVAADGHVEPGRAVLALVVAERGKVLDGVRPAGLPQHMRHRTIDDRVAAAGALVGQAAGSAHAGEHESVLDGGRLLLVLCEPGDGADRARGEEKSVRVAQAFRRQVARQLRGHRDAREVVVGERRVATTCAETRTASVWAGNRSP